MKVIIVIIMFFLMGAFFIVSNEKLALNKDSNLERFKSEYYDWLGNLFENGKSITGYVIESEWLPKTSES